MSLSGMYYVNVVGTLFSWVGNVLSTLNQVFFNMVERLLGMLETLITKTPYPKGDSGNPKFFGEPTGEMWGAMYNMYELTSDLTLIILMILLVVISGVRIFDDYFPSYAQSNKAGKIVKMMFATVLWWPIGVAMLMLSDLLAEAVLVLSSNTDSGGDTVTGLVSAFQEIKGHEDMGFSGDTANGVEGVVLSLALLIPFIFKSGLTILLVFIWIIRYIAIYLLMPLMPLLFALMAFNLPGADDLADFAQETIEMYISLVFLTFPAAVIVVVFGEMSGQMISMIDTIIDGSGGSTATMTLADGAAATGDVSGVVSSVTTLIIGIAFMAALPLIAAGGPFLLMAGSLDEDSIKSAAMGSGAGVLAGKVMDGSKVKEKGSSVGSAVTSVGSGLLGSEAGEDEEESEEEGDSTSSSSRIGRAKQKMTSSINSASNIKEKAKEEAEFMRREGVSTYARTKGKNAKNKVGNSLTKGKVRTGDGIDSLKQRTEDLSESVDDNLERSRDKLSRIKNNPREELKETASQAGSAVMNSYRSKSFDNMSKKEKEELMKDMGLYEEWSEGDKSARELYMNEKETERTTTRDIMEDRAKENKEKRDELTDKLETRLKAAGAWEDYQSGMSAREALEKNVGQEMKPEDLTSYKEAHELGLDPTKMDERGEEASSFNTDRDYTRNATVQDFFDKHGEDLPFDNARELKGWLDDHGWDVDVNSLNHSVVQEELNELGGNLEKGKDYVSDVADEDGKIRVSSPNSQSDEIDGKTIEGYIEKNDPEDIEFHAKQNGYEDENGNAKVNEYLQEVIGNKERPGEERDLTKGERNDSMALIYDDVESADGVHTENIAQDVERVDNEREEATRELNRAGKHIEGEDLTDTDMSQAERDEIANGDVGSSDNSSREDLMDETIPSSAGDGSRDFTDIPNETTENDTSESVNDDINPDAPTEEEKESAAAEMVGEMFS